MLKVRLEETKDNIISKIGDNDFEICISKDYDFLDILVFRNKNVLTNIYVGDTETTEEEARIMLRAYNIELVSPFKEINTVKELSEFMHEKELKWYGDQFEGCNCDLSYEEAEEIYNVKLNVFKKD